MRTIEGFLESVDRAGKRRARSAQTTALAPLPPRVQMRMRTVEELVGSMDGDEWHSLPRWKRIPSLEAGTLRQGVPGLHSSPACHAALPAFMG